jgi:hypothetical protein
MRISVQSVSGVTFLLTSDTDTPVITASDRALLDDRLAGLGVARVLAIEPSSAGVTGFDAALQPHLGPLS